MAKNLQEGQKNQKEGQKGSSWEAQALGKVLLEHIREQRCARRWNIFFKLVIVGLIGLLLIRPLLTHGVGSRIASRVSPHTAVVHVRGEIHAESEANADDIRAALKRAFACKSAKAIILRINSPGGAPVQARQIFDEIRALQKENPEKKVYAAIEETGASAAYLIASAADAIYADATSLVGSIGVYLSDSFGFVDAMQKFGIERRLYTAGKHKAMLDPFSPRDPQVDAFVLRQAENVHKVFIENVKQGRGTRLKSDPDLFSGLIWSGQEALDLGLIDGFGDYHFIAKELAQEEVLVDYTLEAGPWERWTKRFAMSGSLLQRIFSVEGRREIKFH